MRILTNLTGDLAPFYDACVMPVLIDTSDRSEKKACSILRDGRLSQAFSVPSQWDDSAQDTKATEAQLAQGLIPAFSYFHGLACAPCHACIWVRVNLADFHLSQSNRRLFAAGADLRIDYHETAKILTAGDEEKNEYMIFINQYLQSSPHIGLRRENPASLQLADVHTPGFTLGHYDARDAQDNLAALQIIQRTGRSVLLLSHFHDRKRPASPGTFIVLKTLQMMKEAGDTDYAYIGQWNALTTHLDWKANLHGIEMLRHGIWEPLTRHNRDTIRVQITKEYGDPGALRLRPD